MHPTLTLSVVAAFAGLVSSRAINHHARDNRARAAYTFGNDPAGASIVSLHIDQFNGLLSSPVKISTGGLGLAGETGSGIVIVSEDVCKLYDPRQ